MQGARCGIAGIQASVFTRTLDIDANTVPTRAETETLEKYEAILERGVLGTSTNEEHTPSSVRLFGILGQQALIGPAPDSVESYEVGAQLPSGERIIEIEIDEIILEKGGEQRTLEVFSSQYAQPTVADVPSEVPPKSDSKDANKERPSEEVALLSDTSDTDDMVRSSREGITAGALVGTK